MEIKVFRIEQKQWFLAWLIKSSYIQACIANLNFILRKKDNNFIGFGFAGYFWMTVKEQLLFKIFFNWIFVSQEPIILKHGENIANMLFEGSHPNGLTRIGGVPKKKAWWTFLNTLLRPPKTRKSLRPKNQNRNLKYRKVEQKASQTKGWKTIF